MNPAMHHKETLVIFDYSGTLSVEAPRYGSPENLEVQLQRTGLKDLDVRTPTIYWEEIVNPSWEEASTTTAGYKQVMINKIKERMSEKSANTKDSAIKAAVCLFVDDYLGHSRIDSRWQPILTKLYKTPHARTIIATDHYAEATDVIVGYLHQWGIPACRPIETMAVGSGNEVFIVANSADMGVHKSDRYFWVSLKAALRLDEVHRILLIDDFGYNEQAGDDYARKNAVEKRQSATVHLLQEIFPAEVAALPFFLDLPASVAEREKSCKELIKKLSDFIENYLDN